MKLTKITLAAAAFASAALMGATAHAQSAGDVILGFDSAGGSYTYEVDLGDASQFVDLAAGTTLNFSLNSSDLTSYVSSTWSTNTGVQFGVVGGTQIQQSGDLTLGSQTFAADTLFVTANTWAQVPTASTYQGQGVAQGDYNKLLAGYGSPDSGGTYGAAANGTAYATGTKDTEGFDVLSAPSVNFGLPSGLGYVASVIDYNTDDSVPAPTSATLDFYELAPTNADVGTPGATLLGTFGLSDTAGNPELTFTAAAAPEPPTYLLMGLGGLALIGHLRRRAAQI